MARAPRNLVGGQVYHVLNRANLRATIFHKAADYVAFEGIMAEAKAFSPVRVLAYCLMPNHFHLLLWPQEGAAGGRRVSEFMRFLTLTHTQRYHAHYHTAGQGHLYQGRFKSFPVQGGRHFLVAARYVERNPVRAGLVKKARDWGYSSLAARLAGGGPAALLDAWPVRRPRDWEARVEQAVGAKELEALRAGVQRGRPFGDAAWVAATAEELGLEASLRARGRPKLEKERGKKGT
jgi:putative transposase